VNVHFGHDDDDGYGIELHQRVELGGWKFSCTCIHSSLTHQTLYLSH
jgi:hypothetical protein